MLRGSLMKVIDEQLDLRDGRHAAAPEPRHNANTTQPLSRRPERANAECHRENGNANNVILRGSALHPLHKESTKQSMTSAKPSQKHTLGQSAKQSDNHSLNAEVQETDVPFVEKDNA